ncbi:MAG: RHS repeat-associated core domain-containing protein, partial [Terriglobia bacterium]
SYDRFGNMTCTQNQYTNGLCPQYSFSASTNQISNSGYTYDASGDLTNDGVHSYQYDAEGRQVAVDNGLTASYVYNALGERVERDVGGSYTEYVFGKDGNPLGENNRTSWVDTWVDFQGQHIAHYENNETYFIHSNQVGTAGMVTDYSGAVVQDELHYPWGQVWTMAGTQQEERFASLHHRDSATNLDPTHFRMYSSDMGRWMRPDPAGRWSANARRPQSWNRYAYVLNNSTNFADPYGLWTFSVGVSVSGSVGGWNFSYAGGVAVDGNGNVATFNTYGGGGLYLGTGGLSGAVDFGISNGANVTDLTGPFYSEGGSVIGPDGVGGEGSVSYGPSSDGPVTVVSGGVAAGTPGANFTIGATVTDVEEYDWTNAGIIDGQSGYCPVCENSNFC